MKSRSLRLASAVAGLALIAGCGGGGSIGGIATLGSTFQQAFAQNATDNPIDVTNAGLVVQLAQDPFEL